MLCILINHLSIFPSAWQFFTGRGTLWVSAAEGFFFVSGIMLGLIRGREYRASNQLWPVAKKIINRSWRLYLANAIVVLIMIIIAHDLLAMSPSNAIKAGYPGFNTFYQTIFQIITLQTTYGWADFLAFYVIFLLFSIPMLWLLKQKMWYLVIGLAILAWFEPRLAEFPFDKFYFFWSSYFFIGVVVGYHYYDLQTWFRSLSHKLKLTIPYVVVSVFIFSLTANWLINLSAKDYFNSFPEIIKPLFVFLGSLHALTEANLYAERMGVWRLAVFFIWASGLFFIFQKLKPYLVKWLDWLLGEFGRQSLRVYIVNAFTTFIVLLYLKPSGFLVNTVVSGIYVLVVLLIIKLKIVKKIVPN